MLSAWFSRPWGSPEGAPDVDVVRVLVDADVVDAHRRGECEVFHVDVAEEGGHAEVRDKVLWNGEISQRDALQEGRRTRENDTP